MGHTREQVSDSVSDKCTALIQFVVKVKVEFFSSTQYILKYFPKPYRPSDRLECL